MAIPQDFTIEEFKCLICEESSESLKYRTCSHALCDNCLKIYNDESIATQKASTVYQCPICRTEPLSGRSNKQDRKTCDLCARGNDSMSYASYWCHECSDALCDVCFSYHTRLKQSSYHKVIRLRNEPSKPDILNQSRNNSLHLSLCPNHQNEGKTQEFYCRAHQVTCCISCLSSAHPNCKEIYFFEDIVQEKCQSSILPKLHAIHYHLNTTMVTNDIEYEKLKHTFEMKKKIVKASVESAKKSLDNAYQEFEKILFMKTNMVLREFNQRKTDLKTFQNVVGKFEKKILDLSQTDQVEEVLTLIESLKEIIPENFQKLKHYNNNNETQDIDVIVNETVRQVCQLKSVAEIKTLKYRISNNFENLETIVSDIGASSVTNRHSNAYVNSLKLLKSPEIKYISTSDYGTYSDSRDSSNGIKTCTSSEVELNDGILFEEKRDDIKFHLTECLKIKEITINGHIGQCRLLYSDGKKFLFRDYKQEKLYAFETTGKCLFQKVLDRKPWHIVCNASNEVYISFPKSWYIRRYRMSKSGLTDSGTIATPPGVKMFDILGNYIIVTLKDCIKILTYGGLVMKTISIKGRKPLVAASLKNPRFVYNDHAEVVCISVEEESEIYSLLDTELTQEPINMAVDSYETLYIFHKRTDGKLYIQLISYQGKPLRLVKPSIEWYENIDYIGFDREKRYFFMTSVICNCATTQGKKSKEATKCQTIVDIHDMPHSSLESVV